AEYQPLGGHYAPLGSGTGFGGATATGAYQTALPIALPAARGDVPVPFSVVYVGDTRVGEAGLGWRIPIASVHVSDTVSRRKPHQAIAVDPEGPDIDVTRAAQRVFLDLGGGPMLMTHTREQDLYRPVAAQARLE